MVLLLFVGSEVEVEGNESSYPGQPHGISLYRIIKSGPHDLNILRRRIGDIEEPIIRSLYSALVGSSRVDLEEQDSDISEWKAEMAALDISMESRLRTSCRDFIVEFGGPRSSFDVEVLVKQIGLRILCGADVAVAKYEMNRALYDKLASSHDSIGIMKTLTNTVVEETVLARVREKAEAVATRKKRIASQLTFADISATLFSRVVIPLTKDLEVLVLLAAPGASCYLPL